MPATTLRPLVIDEGLECVGNGAAFVDLRPTNAYLDVHIPGSLALLYEFGPGMASRARDCLPLDLPLVLLVADGVDLMNAAAALRGKGFNVLGRVDDGINGWAKLRGTPASTEVTTGEGAPPGTLLDVGDPGARRVPDAVRIPIERLWVRMADVPSDGPVVIVGGFGVRAALAIGMLERSGRRELYFWRAADRG